MHFFLIHLISLPSFFPFALLFLSLRSPSSTIHFLCFFPRDHIISLVYTPTHSLMLTTRQGPDNLSLSLLAMKKTLAVMEVLALCQCGGSGNLLPHYVADGKRKRYHLALLSLEMAIDKVAIITSAQTESGLTKEIHGV